MDEFELPKVGETAPDFVLPTSQGNRLSLGDLLKHGLLVIVFYRGHW